MNNTKQIAIIAIIAALPFTAMADYTYTQTHIPQVEPGGIVKVGLGGPYATIEPTTADETHIATTAYVKGAYNDTIIGINDLFFTKQASLYDYDDDADEEVAVESYLVTSVNDVSRLGQLVSGMAVKNAIADVNTTISNKRVEIYTTWDDDTAKQQVAFVNAQ